MIIDSLCPPAVLYLGFSVIQIIIDLFRGQQNSAFLKVIVMIVFTILLNQLCIGGLTILSWFIVFIPFIMMTYVTTILLYVFGLNPSKGKSQPPDPRRRHKPHPTPYNPREEVGGCAGTEFGCCPDGVTASNVFGSNCYGPGPGPGPQPAPPHHHHHHHHGHYYPPKPQGFSCMKKYGFLTCQRGGSDYGSLKECERHCRNSVPKPDPRPDPSPCKGTVFGCCSDGVTPKNKHGSNCHSIMPIPRYSCLPGMDASCKEDIHGLYTSLADCEQKTKCSQIKWNKFIFYIETI